MKEWFKKKRKSTAEEEAIENHLPEQEEALIEDENEDEEFNLFFIEVLKKFPKKTSAVILKTYDKSKAQAEKSSQKPKINTIVFLMNF